MGNKTCLYQEHLKLGAQMADFSGWDMPMRYSSIKEEVKAVRESVGIFDVSHMGEFLFEGPDANRAIDFIITNDYLNLAVGKAIYSPLCNQQGQVIDDVISYKIKDELSLLCVNAANIDKDREWITSIIQDKQFNCSFKDLSEDYSLIALQGSQSAQLMSLFFQQSFEELDYYQVRSLEHCIIARTGYTGEDGFEIYASHQKTQDYWKAFIELGASPCGLAARDVLRLEVAYPLYGQDITEKLTPYDVGLKWTVKMDKEDFLSKNFLAHYQSPYRLIKFIAEKGVPRPGQALTQQDSIIGQVTSGTHSPTLNKGIGMALVKKAKFSKEDLLFLEIRGRKYPVQYTQKPFVTGGHK